MSRGLTLEISDATYDALQQQAALVGSDPERSCCGDLGTPIRANIWLTHRGRRASCRRTL